MDGNKELSMDQLDNVNGGMGIGIGGIGTEGRVINIIAGLKKINITDAAKGDPRVRLQQDPDGRGPGQVYRHAGFVRSCFEYCSTERHAYIRKRAFPEKYMCARPFGGHFR